MSGTRKPRAADTIVKDPATFDVAAWLADLNQQGFKRRNVEVKMHFRGDLLPRINEIVEQIQAFQADDEREPVGVDEADPLDELRAEYEQLVGEFRAGGHLTFVFRPMNKRIQNETFEAWKKRFGDDATPEQSEELVLARMAASCESFPGSDRFPKPIPVDAFLAFEEEFGTPAFNTLVNGFLEAYEAGGEVSAPFSLKPSPTRGTGALSSD